MLCLELSVMFFFFVGTKASYEMIGYFWHITDIHYDAHFSQHGDAWRGCWRLDYESGSRGSRRPVGRYGDYYCDAPWELIESATKAMMSRQGDNVEFVLWTGDSLSHAPKRNSEDKHLHGLHLLQNLTDLLGKTFSSQFVFPALGHDDPNSKKDLGKMWSRWIPPDTLEKFETGGYYMIERKMLRLQIIVLNTNLMWRSDADDDARKQWDWLTQMLEKIQNNKQTVYIVGHVPPGSDERHRGGNQPPHMYSDYHNKRYLKLVRKYSNIIAGQFFGHLHSDSFRVIYNDHGRPVTWAMLAPSVTPRRTTDGPNNPGLRLYKFNKNTGQILDYTQYYLDLSAANTNPKSEPEWTVEYSFSSYYGISNITPVTLHTLAEKLTLSTPNDNAVFNKYYRANSVKMYSGVQSGCDANCAHTHYCAITRVDYEEHERCLKAAASALASSAALRVSTLDFSILLVLLLVIVKV